MKRILLISLIILSATKINSKREELWRQQVLAGNLLLKPSQRVAPLFGFGQRIIEEQNLLLFQPIDDTLAQNQNYFGGESRLLYGLIDFSHMLKLYVACI